GQRPSPVRVVEQFLTRLAPGVVFGDPNQIEGPGITTLSYTWSLDQGAEALNALYRKYLSEQRGAPVEPSTVFPATRPTDSAAATDWDTFVRMRLGFTYAAVGAADLAGFRTFLTRRYGSIDTLNAAYATTYATFGDISLPLSVPARREALRD